MVTPKLSVWSVTCAWERPTLATMQATTQERILFLCIESSSQNGNWTLPLLGNWENQPRCKLYRWISHAKSVVAKPKDQHSRSVGIRIGIACVSEGHFRMTYFFLFCFHVCRLVLPNLGSVLSHQPFLQPGSLGHHLPFVFLHVVLRSHQSGSSWRRAKCYLTHTGLACSYNPWGQTSPSCLWPEFRSPMCQRNQSTLQDKSTPWMKLLFYVI